MKLWIFRMRLTLFFRGWNGLEISGHVQSVRISRIFVNGTISHNGFVYPEMGVLHFTRESRSGAVPNWKYVKFDHEISSIRNCMI